MLILDTHIVEGAHTADNVIVHGNDTHLQAAAELHVGLAVTQKQHISGIAADVNQEYPEVMVELALLRCDGCVRLGIDEDITDHDGERLVVVNKADGLRALEILGKLFTQDAVMLRRQADCQMNTLNATVHTGPDHLLGHGEQGQNKVAFIPGLVPLVAQSLAGQRLEGSVIFQHLICHRRPNGMLCKASHEAEVGGFDVVVSMIDCD